MKIRWRQNTRCGAPCSKQLNKDAQKTSPTLWPHHFSVSVLKINYVSVCENCTDQRPQSCHVGSGCWNVCACVCVFGIATLVGTFLGKTPLLGGQCYMWGHFFRYLLSDRVFWSSMFPWSNDKKYDPTRLKKSAEIIHTFPKVTFSLVKWFVVGTPCPCRDILQVPDRKEGFLRFDI